MKPEQFDGQHCVLGAPVGWDEHERGPCGGLPVCIECGEIISCWRPSWREAFRLLFGWRVWLTVVARGMPPVSILVQPKQPVERIHVGMA